MDVQQARRRSAAVFGNEKLAEVVLFVAAERAPVTAQVVTTGTGVTYSLARDALRRLVSAGVIQELPRLGGTRSPLYYEVVDGRLWGLFVELAREVSSDRDSTVV